MWEITNWCHWLPAWSDELPVLINTVRDWLNWENPDITQAHVLNYMASILWWVSVDTRLLPTVHDVPDAFRSKVKMNLDGVLSMLND